MSWRQRILDHGKALGRPTYEHALGVGIAFEDGCDVFWVLPGEVMSTVAVPAEGPADVEALLAEYDAIGRLRERALHVIRHYVASQKIRIDRSADGNWAWETPGGMSSSVQMGAGLTAAARELRDVYALVAARLKNAYLGKVPSRRRIDRYLNTEGSPEHERPVLRGNERDADAEAAEAAQRFTIRQVLGLMGLCKALDQPEKLVDAAALRAAVESSGRIGQAMERLADRLPAVDARIDLLKPASISLQFDDGAASFKVDTRSKSLARRIRDEGPAVGDQLADEYLRLNSARRRVLRAIYRAASRRGWRKQEFGGIFGAEGRTYLGETHREVHFNQTTDLTDALRSAAPDAVLRETFKAAPDFAAECVEALNDPSPDDPSDLPEAELIPRDVPPAPPLREIDPAAVQEMDRFAADALRGFLHAERTIYEHRNRTVFDPAIDTWATPAEWVELARPLALREEWPHPTAVLILLDANDPAADAAARRVLDVAEPHHEVGDAEVEIVWRYRHARPELARQWFMPSLDGDDVPFAKVRAKLGDPVAARYVAAGDVESLDLDDDADAITRQPPQRQAQVHRALLAWARTESRCSPPEDAKLRVAVAMGWRDVGEALAENPFLAAGLLTRARRADQFDEPGMLLAKDFLLAWSALAPTVLLARLLATARATDLVGLANEAGRASAVGKPEVEKVLPMSAEIYRTWMKELEPAMAIAWTRCRRVGVV